MSPHAPQAELKLGMCTTVICEKLDWLRPVFCNHVAYMNEDEQDQTVYKVVINHEEQYSIWPADRENPLGWRDVGKQALKQECLDYIKEVWTDMRPLSVRKQMDAARSS